MTRVRVYRNLTRECWSIQEKTSKGWRVIGHQHHLILKDARFIVSKAGQARVRREGKKYVHAYVEGELVSAIERPKSGRTIRYNPYFSDTFEYLDSKEQVKNGVDVYLT